VKHQFRGDGIVLEAALAFWVNRFYEAARRAMYREFRAHGVELTPEQWMVLVRLWEIDRRTQTELAAAIHRDAPTTSRIVDAMARGGLVERVPDPDDARGRRVVLTARGQRLKPTLVPVVKRLVAKMEAGIAARDLELTRATLQRLTANLE